jgi:hypothetical protein
MSEHRLAVRAVQVFGQSNPIIGLAQKPCQSLTAGFPWLAAQIAAVEFE